MSDGKAVTYEFYAGMTCGGCSSAVTRILNKLEGVSNITTDVETKKVTCTATIPHETILAKLTKWGNASQKEVRYVGVVA